MLRIEEFLSAIESLDLRYHFDHARIPNTIHRIGRFGIVTGWQNKNIPIRGSEQLLRDLSPILPSSHVSYHNDSQLTNFKNQQTPPFAIVCGLGAEEDHLYAELLAQFRLIGWQHVPIYRFFGDALTNALSGMHPLSGSQPTPDIAWDRYIFYAIICTGRTGSAHLCDLLDSTGVCGHPKEHLREPLLYCARYDLVDTKSIICHLILRESTPNRVFGTKLISRFFLELISSSTSNRLASILPTIRIIHLSRQDKVEFFFQAFLDQILFDVLPGSPVSDIGNYNRL